MRVVKINLEKVQVKILKKMADVVKDGGVVAMPFDTCYGLAADATSRAAVEKVFKIKQRSFSKPVSVVMKDLEMIKKFAEIDKKTEKILKKYLPGPYALILKAKKSAKIITKFKGTISVRIPDFELTQKLAEILNKPYTATSANLSGQPPAWSGKEVVEIFKNQKYQPDLILDAGPIPQKPLSKILDLKNISPKIINRN